VITYLWEKWKKRKKKLNREVHNALFQDNPMVPEPLLENYRREWVIDDYPYGHTEYCRCESCRVARQHRNTYANLNRDYFIPLREKKQDFLPKKDIKSHKLVERKYAMRRPGIYTREVDYSNMYRRLRNENE
jgi:hypothetical protein